MTGWQGLLILRLVGPYPGARYSPRHRNQTFRAIWGFRSRSPMALPCHPMPITLGPFQYSHDGIASAERRAGMGVRIEVEEGETIADALRRFRKQILAQGGYTLIYPCKWHKRSPRFYVKSSVLNRRRRWIIRVRKRGYGLYNPDWEYDWIDDLETRPRRSWGPWGRV